jgi:polyhydroxyalkanoate synthesis regulator phasin
MSSPLWRKPFDLVERPLAAASESLVQRDAFMDVAAAAFRAQRRVEAEVRRGAEQVLHVWGMPTRSDVTALVNQVARLEREVRDLRDGSA